MAKSYQFRVFGGGTGSTADEPSQPNACHFATENEAYKAGAELLQRWTMPSDYVVVESDAEPNYEFPDGCSRPQPIKGAS